MNHALLTRTLCAIILALPIACARPGHLSSRCVPPSSRGTWTTTTADGRLEGEVKDLKEKTPLGNVEVVLDSGVARRRSNENGRFAFDDVPEGRHLITTSAGAYLTHGDTVMMPMRGGLAGTLSLALRRDVLTRCEIYRP